MSGLRSALDELASQDCGGLPDAQLEDDFSELFGAWELLLGQLLARLVHIDRRSTWASEGRLSTVSWLRARYGVSAGMAKELVRLARNLDEMPRTRKALMAGDISSSAVRVLASVREAHPAEFSAHEEILVEAATKLSVRELGHAVTYWSQAVDGDVALDHAQRLHDRRHLHVSPMLDGMVRVDGDLDPETGETLITALRSVMDADSRSGRTDPRTPAQRRADALHEICRGWLDRRDRPAVAGERPHVLVTVDLESLRGRAGTTCELDHTGPVHPETARRIACDASVSRVITRGRSEPLDVGRKTEAVPAAIRRALIIRDRHCRFPGCDRPQHWCDAHHVIHWADGGPTAMHNLMLLCRRHHRAVHVGPDQAGNGERPTDVQAARRLGPD
jgi:hypothetical protein